MKLENLVYMANRIGEFFAAMPDRDEARDGIANHIKRYWEPRMRKVLVDHLEDRRLWQGARQWPGRYRAPRR